MLVDIDGRELPLPDLDSITFREAGLIKRVTGLKMGQFGQAFEEGDVDIVLALALLAVKRADGVVDDDILLDMPITKVVMKDDEEEPEAEEEPESGNAEAVEEAAETAKKPSAAKSKS